MRPWLLMVTLATKEDKLIGFYVCCKILGSNLFASSLESFFYPILVFIFLFSYYYYFLYFSLLFFYILRFKLRSFKQAGYLSLGVCMRHHINVY